MQKDSSPEYEQVTIYLQNIDEESDEGVKVFDFTIFPDPDYDS